jgi:hypothetical protein
MTRREIRTMARRKVAGAIIAAIEHGDAWTESGYRLEPLSDREVAALNQELRRIAANLGAGFHPADL